MYREGVNLVSYVKGRVTANRMTVHSDWLIHLFSSSSIYLVIRTRTMRWVRHVARIGELRNAYVVLVWRPEGKPPRGRSGSRWEDKRPTKMDLKEMWSGWKGMDWVHLAQKRHEWRCIKCGECLTSRVVLLLGRLFGLVGFDLVWLAWLVFLFGWLD
jgi:hypothetical protein